jgi:hypothetical protein
MIDGYDDDDDDDDCRAISGMNEWQGKQKHSEETCPRVALFITDPGLEPGPPRWEADDYPPGLVRCTDAESPEAPRFHRGCVV